MAGSVVLIPATLLCFNIPAQWQGYFDIPTQWLGQYEDLHNAKVYKYFDIPAQWQGLILLRGLSRKRVSDLRPAQATMAPFYLSSFEYLNTIRVVPDKESVQVSLPRGNIFVRS